MKLNFILTLISFCLNLMMSITLILLLTLMNTINAAMLQKIFNTAVAKVIFEQKVISILNNTSSLYQIFDMMLFKIEMI